MDGLHSFEPEGHRHFIDGDRVPSVTQILERTGIRSFEFCSEESRERGSEIHLACAIIDRHGIDALLWDSLEDDCIQKVKAFVKFRRENPRFRPVRIEEAVWSKTRRFAGVLDREEEILPSRKSAAVTYAVLDIKSGDEDDSTGEQTAAYDFALPPAPKGYRERFGLYLKDDGEYNLEPYRNGNDRYVFLSALACAHRQIERRGWKAWDGWKAAA